MEYGRPRTRDGNARDELTGKIEDNDADRASGVRTGLKEGCGKIVKDRVHPKILDRNRANVNPHPHGVIAPVLWRPRFIPGLTSGAGSGSGSNLRCQRCFNQWSAYLAGDL